MNNTTSITTSLSTSVPPGGVTDADEIEIKTDTRPAIRLGFWVLVVGFGLFLAWAAWAPLDEGVAAPATVSVETRRKAIQHVQGGVVKQLAVKEGAEVKQDDVLVVLDDGATRATYEAIRQNYLAQRALEGRLLAELTDARSITYHADLLDTNDAIAKQHMVVQQQVFASRRAAQVAEIAANEQAIVGLQGQISSLKLLLENKRQQLSYQTRQLVGVKALADDGYAPKNQALQMAQAETELRSSLTDIEANIQRSESAIAEARLRIAQRKQEYMKEASTQLADVRREVQANQERLAAISTDLSRMQIRAPVAGQVVGLTLGGPGGVVSPGQRLMDILPRGESLLLDAKIAPAVIDRVRVGDTVEVRFSAFANTPQLVAQGKLISLSGDAVSEGNSSPPFYLARVALTDSGRKELGDRVMQPGMNAEVLIKTGERSLLTYLMHPLIKRVKSSMIEE